MSLTGSGLLWVLAALAAALFAAVVSGWPRRGPAALRITGRALPVLALNGVVVLGCLAVLNDQYVFYTSWGDLFGSRQAQAFAHHGGTTSAALTATVVGPGLAPGRRAARRHPPPAGSPDAALHGARPRDRCLGARARLPAHGVRPGRQPDLPGDPGPARVAGRAPELHPRSLPQHATPSPPPTGWPRRSWSSPDQRPANHRHRVRRRPSGDPRTDTWLSSVVPRWAVSHLHVQTRRTSWTTLGYSYGGWCAASVAMRHPDVFGGAVVFEGYFQPDFLAGYDPLGPAQLKGYDLVHLAAHAPPPIAMWVFASRQDTLAYPTTARFLATARSPLSVSATIVKVGGHRTSIYSPYVRPALQWLASTLPGFGP